MHLLPRRTLFASRNMVLANDMGSTQPRALANFDDIIISFRMCMRTDGTATLFACTMFTLVHAFDWTPDYRTPVHWASRAGQRLWIYLYLAVAGLLLARDVTACPIYLR